MVRQALGAPENDHPRAKEPGLMQKADDRISLILDIYADQFAPWFADTAQGNQTAWAARDDLLSLDAVRERRPLVQAIRQGARAFERYADVESKREKRICVEIEKDRSGHTYDYKVHELVGPTDLQKVTPDQLYELVVGKLMNDVPFDAQERVELKMAFVDTCRDRPLKVAPGERVLDDAIFTVPDPRLWPGTLVATNPRFAGALPTGTFLNKTLTTLRTQPPAVVRSRPEPKHYHPSLPNDVAVRLNAVQDAAHALSSTFRPLSAERRESATQTVLTNLALDAQVLERYFSSYEHALVAHTLRENLSHALLWKDVKGLVPGLADRIIDASDAWGSYARQTEPELLYLSARFHPVSPLAPTFLDAEIEAAPKTSPRGRYVDRLEGDTIVRTVGRSAGPRGEATPEGPGLA